MEEIEEVGGLGEYLNSFDTAVKKDPNSLIDYLTSFEEASDYKKRFEKAASGTFATQEETRFTGTRGGKSNEYLSAFTSEQGFLDLDEVQAQAQSNSEMLARGAGRLATGLAVNILQIPGYVGGALGAAANELFSTGDGSMDTFVNNWWVDGLEGAKEHFNNDIAPIYVKKAVKDGNLWDNVKSLGFWSTEGADGLAFLLSAFAPGAAVKAFGTGAKLANALGRSKAFINGTKVLSKADEIAAATGLTTVENAVNVVGATFANTVFEAGVEGDGAISSYKQNLDGMLMSGQIGAEKYKELIVRAPDQGAKVFRDNLGILLVPNLIMSKMLFGKAIPKGQLSKFKIDGKKISPELIGVSKKAKAAKIGKTIGAATTSEGFIEEAGQMTSEKYHTEGYIDKMLGHGEKSWGETYFDVLGSTEGQKAIFLGALFGSGAMMVGNYKQRKADTKQATKLAEIMTNGVNFFESTIDGIYEKTEDGDIIFENGEPVVNKNKVAELGENLDYIKSVEMAKAQYEELAKMGVPGAEVKAALLEQNLVNNMLNSFVHAGEEGIALLRNYLENSEGLKTLTKSVNAGREIKKTEKEVINDLVKEAEALRKDTEFFQKYGEFENELYKNKKDKKYYDKYATLLRNKYATSKSSLRFLEEAQADLEDARVFAIREFKKDTKISDSRDLEYVPSNDRIKQLDNRISIVKELKADTQEELDALNSVSKQKATYKKFKESEIKKEEAAVEAAELDDVLAQINGTSSEEDMNKVDIPAKFKTGTAAKVIQDTKNKKATELLNHKKEQEASAKEKSKGVTDTKDQELAVLENQIEYIKNNFNVGEAMPITNLPLPEGFVGDTAIFKAITDTGVIVTDSEGNEFTLNIAELYNDVYDPEKAFGTEGGRTGPTIEKNKNTLTNFVSIDNDARVVISNNPKDESISTPLYDTKMFRDAHEFEQTPSDKTGYYGITLNKAEGYVPKGKAKQALDALEAKDFSDMELLIDYLPLVVNLSDVIQAPLENRTKEKVKKDEAGKAIPTIYERTTRKLKEVIVKELAKGTPMSSIEIYIKGQYGGQIQLDNENGVAENNIKDLDFFKGDIENVTADQIYVVDERGILRSIVPDKNGAYKTDLSQKRTLAPGEIYIKIKTANGTPFPLKLNVSKVSNEVADLLHDLYTLRFEDFEDGGRIKGENVGGTARLSTVAPEILAKFEENFPEEAKLFTTDQKAADDITIKDLIDFFIWNGTTSPKSQVRFRNGELLVGTEVYTKEEFEANKASFIDVITSVKRRHIKIRKKKNDSVDIALTGKEYLQYLIRNKLLNTNAVVNEPTFQGRTTMYITTNTVKVNGELSTFNKDVVKEYRKNLLGSNSGLKGKLSRLFDKKLELTDDEKHYQDEFGNLFKRITELKDSTFTPTDKSTNGAKRGNVADKLLRDFFMPGNDLTDVKLFTLRGKKYLDIQNKEKDSTTLIMGDPFFEKLYTIYNEYKDIFDSLNYSIYSNVPTIPLEFDGKMYAGTVDLLAFDNTSKEWVIIDLKTSSFDRAAAYADTVNDDFDYLEKDTKQQTAYAAALEQTTGITASRLLILPITTKSDKKEDSGIYLTSVPQKVKGEPFLEISMEKTIFELKGKTRKGGKTANKIDTGQFEGDGNELPGENLTAEEEADKEAGGGILAGFGVEVKEAVKEATPKIAATEAARQTSDVETKKAEIERELFTTPISLNNWTSLEHTKYIKLLELRGDLETRDLLRNLNPRDSWQVYTVETLSEKEAGNILSSVAPVVKKGLTQKEVDFAFEQYKQGIEVIGGITRVIINNVEYVVTNPILEQVNGEWTVVNGLFVMVAETGKIITEEKLYKQAVEERNNTIAKSNGMLPGTKIGKQNANKVWNSRFNFVSLQPKKITAKGKPKTVEIKKVEKVVNSIDFDNMEEATAYKIFKTLKTKYIKGNATRMKQINIIIKNKSNVEALKGTINYLVSEKISQEELNKECK